jgi:outer membrane protein assembly factor BamB
MNTKMLLAATCIVVLAGCSGGSTTATTASTPTTTTTTTPTTPPTTTPTPPASTAPGNDVSRSGLNRTETMLTTSNVASSSFGLLRNLPVDGKIDAQPLYLSQLSIAGVAHNVVFAATEHGSVYAFDANSGAVLWQVSLLKAAETSSGSLGCYQVMPEIGVTATPVIDRSAGAHGTIFIVAMSLDASSNYHQRLHALDVTTGTELLGGPTEISASVATAAGGTNAFNPTQYEERAALLLSNGSIYLSFTSHCDAPPYSGWVMTYAESTLAQTAVLNVAQNSDSGPAIWMAGGGPAADASGNVYLLTANGAFETTLNAAGFPNLGDFGNSFLKISNAGAAQAGAAQAGAAGGSLAVADYFALTNTVALSAADQDLGSGGAMLLPDLTDSGGAVHHLVVGAGKDGNIYVVNRDSMGKFSPTANNIYQQLTGAVAGGIFSTPAYFNNTVYYADVGGSLKAFAIRNAMLSAAPQTQSVVQFPFPGSAISVSANGTANGIVWAHENTSPGILYAFDATNLTHELYDSTQAGSRDQFGNGNKFITPTIADGQVFVGTTNSLAIFGLLQ